MKKILILGAGVTGLSAAWKLSEHGYDVKIIDKDIAVGGLAKTIKFNENYIDIGPHSFFSEDKEIYETVKSLFKDEPEELPKVERSVKMFFMNYYVDYPLSAKSILFQMGPIIPILSFLSFAKSYIKSFFVKKKDEQKNTIEKWAIENFGYFLFKNFFKPYTEQFWKIGCDKLSHKVIPASKKLDFAKTLKHLFLNKYLEISKREPGSLNLVQRESLPTFYPKKGFGQIVNKIAEKVNSNNGKIILNEKIEKVTLDKNNRFNVQTQKNKYESDILISTLPLDYFAKIFEPLNQDKLLLKNSENLKYLALTMLYLNIKKKNVLGCQYCYFINRPYNRVSELNQFSDQVSKDGTTTLSIEISCHENGDIWNKTKEEIYDLCIQNLVKDKILTKEDILEWKVIKVPNVYPIYKIDYEKNLNYLNNEFRNINNFYSIGRLGKFFYGDIDQMIRFGFNISSKIKSKKN